MGLSMQSARKRQWDTRVRVCLCAHERRVKVSTKLKGAMEGGGFGPNGGVGKGLVGL